MSVDGELQCSGSAIIYQDVQYSRAIGLNFNFLATNVNDGG